MVKREIIYRTDENYAYIKVGECPFIKFDLYKLDMIKQYQWGYTIGRLPSAKRCPITKFLFPDIEKPQYKDKNKYNMTDANVEDLYKPCWIENDICYIPLSNGKIVQCDSKFFDLVNNKVWEDARTGIVTRTGRDHLNPKSIRLKNLLFPGINFIKFIDGNRYNYQSKNISFIKQTKEIINNICYIYINKKVILCSIEDYNKIKPYTWSINKNGYPMTKIKGKSIEMHKMLTNYPICDHINRNKLDNRQCNLREANLENNLYNKSRYKNNKSGYKGVYFDKQENKYIASIGYKKKQIKIGRYNTKEEAAIAYDNYAKILYGEFACLNFES